MKKLLLTAILGAFTSLLYAQDVNPLNSLRVGVNRAFFGAGDITGPALYVEYSRELLPFLAVTPRIMSAYGNSRNDYFVNQASDFGTSLSLRFTPFPNRGLRRVKFDVGGLYHRFIQSYGSVLSPDEYGLIATENSFYRREDLVGFIGSINVSALDNHRFDLGARLDLLTSLSGGYLNADSFQTGLYFGMKF